MQPLTSCQTGSDAWRYTAPAVPPGDTICDRLQGSQQAKTHAYEMYAIWELHACEMAYGRGTHMRDTPMR
jgi:hypothetical protein